MSIFDVFSRRQRPHNRSHERVRGDQVQDALTFLMNCDTNEFFDFIELSFKLELTPQAMGDENQVIDAINEIFRSDDISERLRNRILLLYRDVISGQWSRAGDYTFEFWSQMHNSLEHLYGRPQLYDVENEPYKLTQLVRIEEKKGHYTHIRTSAYPKIIRVEDEAVYSEAIAPALSALSAPHFEPANAEFQEAMEEYRKGHYGDCLTKCGSAFESVLKILCKRNRWSFSETDTAAPLLKIVISNSSLNTFFEQPLMLIATIRNRLSSAHGSGSHPRSVERHIGQYAVSSTAAAIVLLVHEADK